MLNLDQKYSDLIDQLQILNTKLDQFINGDDTVTIQTDSGIIKSLAGIIKDINTPRVLQKIIDHKTYADMTADLSIQEGMLIRVWGDATVGVDGIYEYQNSVFTKISYADLYDLTQP